MYPGRLELYDSNPRYFNIMAAEPPPALSLGVFLNVSFTSTPIHLA